MTTALNLGGVLLQLYADASLKTRQGKQAYWQSLLDFGSVPEIILDLWWLQCINQSVHGHYSAAVPACMTQVFSP